MLVIQQRELPNWCKTSWVKLQRFKLCSKLDFENVEDNCCLDNLQDSEQNLQQIYRHFIDTSNLSVPYQQLCDLKEYETVPLPEETEFFLKFSQAKLKFRI